MTTIDILKNTYILLAPAHKRKLVWCGIIMLAVAFFEIALAGVISLLGVALSSPETLETLPVIGAVFVFLAKSSSAPPVVTMLIAVLCLVACATVCKNTVTAYMAYVQTNVSHTIAWDVGVYTFAKYLYAPYIWHTQQNMAELGGYLGWRMHLSLFWMAALTVCTQVAVMLFLMFTALALAPAPAMLLYGVCGFFAFVTYKLTQKKVRELGDENAQQNVQAGKVSHYAMQGMREVHIYNQRKPFYEQYASFAQPLVKIASKQSVFPALPQWVLESMGLTLLLGAVLLMQWRGESVPVITGTLTLMAGISWRLLPAMNRFVGATLQIKANYSPASKLVKKIQEIPQETLSAKSIPFENSIELKKVSFCYPSAKKKALEDINISIKKGNMVGLVGLSGAGKSTLVNLLTGLLPPCDGNFYIDGKAVISQSGFLNIGYVPQAPYIMDATLAENVAFSDWGKRIDEERVLECCRMAAVNFLEDLSEGIHTTLGDRGVRLSGGQIQRVAIARALYTKPDILLFDEATSALDGAAEASIQKTILSLRENLTIVIVAHRLSTVEGCDRVYWLHEGRLKDVEKCQNTLIEYKKYLETQSD